MRINIGASIIEWNGGHYGNVFCDGREVDVFSFAWEKNHPSAIDFVDAAISHIEYSDSIENDFFGVEV